MERSKKFGVTIFLLLFVVLSVCAVGPAGQLRLLPIKKVSGQSELFQASVISIDNTNRDGVTRIGICLIGIPHTSCRIDSIKLIKRNGVYMASDIDGIDFGRYFQWEDDGMVEIEVDFPRQNVMPEDSVEFITVKGSVKHPVGKFASIKK